MNLRRYRAVQGAAGLYSVPAMNKQPADTAENAARQAAFNALIDGTDLTVDQVKLACAYGNACYDHGAAATFDAGKKLRSAAPWSNDTALPQELADAVAQVAAHMVQSKILRPHHQTELYRDVVEMAHVAEYLDCDDYSMTEDGARWALDTVLRCAR